MTDSTALSVAINALGNVLNNFLPPVPAQSPIFFLLLVLFNSTLQLDLDRKHIPKQVPLWIMNGMKKLVHPQVSLYISNYVQLKPSRMQLCSMWIASFCMWFLFLWNSLDIVMSWLWGSARWWDREQLFRRWLLRQNLMRWVRIAFCVSHY